MTEPKAITRIQVQGFRSLKSIDLEPGRITVLIGANGSGKSNLLSVLRMVPLLRTQSLRRFVAESGGASALLHYGSSATQEFGLRIEFTENTGFYAYSAKLGYTSGDTLHFDEEGIEGRPLGDHEPLTESLGAGHIESRLDEAARGLASTDLKVVRAWLSGMSFFHFHDTSRTSPLRQNARQSEDQYLRSDGSNLAAYLFILANSDATDDIAAWKRIGMLVRRVAPYIKRLVPERVDPSHPERSALRLRWIDENDHRFDVSDLSDGTLRALALITALSQPVNRLPRFLSIDEPELGLHPAALGLVADLVRSVSSRCQVLLATQSPALLDHFEPGEVVVAERQSGETSLRRLDAARLASWLEDYSLSELFDKNILGGRPHFDALGSLAGATP